MKRRYMIKKRSSVNWMFYPVAIAFVFLVGFALYSEYKDYKNGCEPTGEQRMVNSILNAPKGALSGLAVQDKFLCKDGSVKWKQKLN